MSLKKMCSLIFSIFLFLSSNMYVLIILSFKILGIKIQMLQIFKRIENNLCDFNEFHQHLNSNA